jgi:hypothetical protein
MNAAPSGSDLALPAPNEVRTVTAESSPAATSVSGDATDAAQKDDVSLIAGEGKGSASSKPKTEIENFEQFIAYAFGRKGQRVTLKPKVERLIAQNLRLDEDALLRLFTLADADVTLAVPRQLLFVSREILGLPALRAALSKFAFDVMLRHRVFHDAGMQAMLNNLPEALSAGAALNHLAKYQPSPIPDTDVLKPAELQALRLNAVQLLATWLASTRSINLEELSSLLFQSVWEPAARDLVDDNARLRALTEIEQLAGVGLACDKFRQRAVDANAAQVQAYREAAGLRETVALLSSQIERTQTERDAMDAELQNLKESKASELSEARKQHEIERTHLRHEMEQMRGRLVRRLGDSIEMLEVGLKALNNKTPRTEVMTERAEHVIDALRAEETKLREE